MQYYETTSLFLLGGTAYIGLELAWRGTTHWTMFVAGGLSLCYLAWLCAWPRMPLVLCALLGAAGISCIELVFGLVCTRLLHFQVWDYSREWGNLAGLVCPKYTLLWLILCAWVIWLMRTLQTVLQ